MLTEDVERHRVADGPLQQRVGRAARVDLSVVLGGRRQLQPADGRLSGVRRRLHAVVQARHLGAVVPPREDGRRLAGAAPAPDDERLAGARLGRLRADGEGGRRDWRTEEEGEGKGRGGEGGRRDWRTEGDEGRGEGRGRLGGLADRGG